MPELDDSPPKTVYVEKLPAGATVDIVRSIFETCGPVACVTLPRCASRDEHGYAFVEFETQDGADAAVAQLQGRPGRQGDWPLRVMKKGEWRMFKKSYIAAKKSRTEEESARRIADKAAEDGPSRAAAVSRNVLLLSQIKRNGNVKELRREIGELARAIAPTKFVDCGISNSGDPTVAYVRMKTDVGAAEVVRILTSRQQKINGGVVCCELLSGDALIEYNEKIAKIRAATNATRKKKRDEWWSRKYKSSADKDGASERSREYAGEVDRQDSTLRTHEQDHTAGKTNDVARVDAAQSSTGTQLGTKTAAQSGSMRISQSGTGAAVQLGAKTAARPSAEPSPKRART